MKHTSLCGKAALSIAALLEEWEVSTENKFQNFKNVLNLCYTERKDLINYIFLFGFIPW